MLMKMVYEIWECNAWMDFLRGVSQLALVHMSLRSMQDPWDSDIASLTFFNETWKNNFYKHLSCLRLSMIEELCRLFRSPTGRKTHKTACLCLCCERYIDLGHDAPKSLGYLSNS